MADNVKNSVLVVDDDTENIMALTHMLRPEYTVYADKDGRSAIETAGELMPDIILLDVIMPDMDGYEVLSALKANSKTCDIPVIFITGQSDAPSEEKGLSLGAVDYIIKPFSPVNVKLRVGNQIKLIRQMRLLLEKEAEERSNNARMELFLNMSYEMLTPMNTIMGMTHTAKKTDNIKEIQNCLDEIDNASKELLQQIKMLSE